MGSLPRVTSLTKTLLSKTGLQQLPCLRQRPYTAVAAPGVNVVRQVTNIPVKNEEMNELQINEKWNITAVNNGDENEYKGIATLGRAVKSEEVIKMNATNSLLEKRENVKSVDCRAPGGGRLSGLLSSGRGIPWHSLVSLSKLNALQSRGYADVVAGEDKCIPRKMKLPEVPLPCVIIRRPPQPCVTPMQKKWLVPEASICLPCCTKVEKPLRCDILDIRVNNCPRKTYRVAAYSECSKRYGKYQHKKECCYRKRICYARNLAAREILPLMPIRDRQAHVLGFDAKTPEEPWGN